MSRTDKDRPYAVRLRDETDGSYIDHDHRNGECIVEPDSIRYLEFRRRQHNCNKRLIGEWFCTKKNPVRLPYNRAFFIFFTRECWASWRSADGHWLSRQCVGHRDVSYEPEIPCKCDNYPPMATCDYTVPDPHYIGYRECGVPKWFIDHTWNNPERVRERDELKKAVALYNGGDWEDEDFDFDFPNHQHRHGAGWYYW